MRDSIYFEGQQTGWTVVNLDREDVALGVLHMKNTNVMS